MKLQCKRESKRRDKKRKPSRDFTNNKHGVWEWGHYKLICFVSNNFVLSLAV